MFIDRRSSERQASWLRLNYEGTIKNKFFTSLLLIDSQEEPAKTDPIATLNIQHIPTSLNIWIAYCIPFFMWFLIGCFVFRLIQKNVCMRNDRKESEEKKISISCANEMKEMAINFNISRTKHKTTSKAFKWLQFTLFMPDS